MNFLVTGAVGATDECMCQMRELGHNVKLQQWEKEQLVCDYEWVEGVICNGLFMYHKLNKFVNLKYIQLTSAGYDRVPMEEVSRRGIEIYNARGVYSIPIAEYVFANVLYLYKEIGFFRHNQEKHLWKKKRNIEELFGKRVCVVGCGNVGTECAKRFRTFGCKVTGVDLTSVSNTQYDTVISIEEFDKVLSLMDVVILTVPLTKDTYHMMNYSRLCRMKDGAVLVNVSRGHVIDTEALCKVQDKFLGLVLDVFEEEPLDAASSLWNCPNVIITPHNSFSGSGNTNRLLEVIKKNIEGNCK